MTGHRGRVRLGLASAGLAIGLLWGAGGAMVTAQGSSPDAAGSGACEDLAALLPAQLDGAALTTQVVAGTELLSDAFAPLFQGTGLSAADLCVVVIAYGATAATWTH